MPITDNSYFGNSYTFTIDETNYQIPGPSDEIEYYKEIATKNAVSVINYISNYVSWKGTLDFVLKVDTPQRTGLLPSFGGVDLNGKTFAMNEAFTGTDANGASHDAGAYLRPNVNGTLTNYGSPLYFDPNPDPYATPSIPAGSHDFFSIYMHEVLHAFGFWSTAQHAGSGNSAFDQLTTEQNGQYFFNGPATVALLGTALPLATTGSRDHYGANTVGGISPIDRGAMFEFGNYEDNRWHLGKLELAVLQDLGYTVANQDKLPLVEQADGSGAFYGTPILEGNVTGLTFTGSSEAETIRGTIGNDTIAIGGGNDVIDGRNGRDTASLGASKSQVTVTNDRDGTFTIMSGNDTLDLSNIERLQFVNGSSNFPTLGKVKFPSLLGFGCQPLM